jgi:hypothetical protein
LLAPFQAFLVNIDFKSATLHGGKGDKPYKIMMARFILQEIVDDDGKQFCFFKAFDQTETHLKVFMFQQIAF